MCGELQIPGSAPLDMSVTLSISVVTLGPAVEMLPRPPAVEATLAGTSFHASEAQALDIPVGCEINAQKTFLWQPREFRQRLNHGNKSWVTHPPRFCVCGCSDSG